MTVSRSRLPSVDRLVREAPLAAAIDVHGRALVVDAVRQTLAKHREHWAEEAPSASELVAEIASVLDARPAGLRRVYNMTGTVLHTNLGRAVMSAAVAREVAEVMQQPCNLEYDLATGDRGERDSLVEGLLRELTGAEAATVVNNNAAAVLLALSALAENREVIVSRGELIEIGGAFRMPDIMRVSHVRLVEVGTTNRTHAHDYERAAGPDAAAIMKVHTSNYHIEGFVAEVGTRELAAIARAKGLPLIVDLGAGSLVDMSAYGLPREPVVREVLADGADVVTFSGDKLLGGPQCGLVVGSAETLARIRRHPLKRALRLSKMTLAALEATLKLYRNPVRLAADLPTLRLLTRPVAELEALAARLVPAVAAALGAGWQVSIAATQAQAGSGSLPGDTIASVALAIAAPDQSGGALKNLAARLRGLPRPVIGRIAEGRLLLDLRCLEDEADFAGQLSALGEMP